MDQCMYFEWRTGLEGEREGLGCAYISHLDIGNGEVAYMDIVEGKENNIVVDVAQAWIGGKDGLG